jgi:hypothetical protein
MKKCKVCGIDKELFEFPKTGAVCKSCRASKLREYRKNNLIVNSNRKEYRKRNRNKINEQKRLSYQKNNSIIKQKNNKYYHSNAEYCKTRQREYQSKVETKNIDTWICKCIKHAKASDKKYGRGFDLDFDYIKQMYGIQDGNCALSGVKMLHDRNNLFSLSIDRIDPKSGHIKGNVQLVCQAVNLAKREYSCEHLVDFLENCLDSKLAEFTGFNYNESISNYDLLKRRKLKRELRKLFSDFVPPSFIVDELKNDYDEILRLEVDDYLIDGIWRSHKPDGKPWAGKRLIWHFQPHLWDVRTLGKSLMSEVWGKDCDIFERALNNLVAGKSITYDRIIREFVFAGVGVPSQIHAGFAKAVFKHFGGKSVFDPFAGWGGRMLAAASLGLRYTACDLSRKTVDGLNNMAKFIGFDCDISTNDCFDISIPNADIMFTSPPFGSEEYIDSNSSVDLGKLIEVTNHIPVRILHLNRHMANLTGWDLVPIQARVRAAGDSSQEFLAVKIRDDCSTCEFSTGVKCSLSRCPKLPDGT